MADTVPDAWEVLVANSGTILLIEDEVEIADLLRMFLEREGFRLVHAASGEQGLE